MSLFNELKRRNVFRVATAYLLGSWFVIQVAETIFPLFGLGDAPARLVVILLAIAFVPTLVIAWAFEITPEGLKRERDVIRDDSLTHQAGKKLDRIILVVLTLAVGYFAFDKFVLDPIEDALIAESAHQEGRSEALTGSLGDKSIAVLPFVNMSEDAGNEYFSDGIAEELINLLTRVPELRVVARTSAFSYKGKDIRVSQVARDLRVGHILEGSVRKAGNRVRVTAQLIEADSESHLWSETYDRTLDDIFAIQDEIAANVVRRLKITLLSELPRRRKVDPEAYALWLQGNHLLRQYNEDAWGEAFVLFEQALEIEPGYAQARFGLITRLYLELMEGRVAYAEGSAKIHTALQEVLELDPNVGVFHGQLGLQFLNDYKLSEAALHMQRAMQLAPNSTSVLEKVALMLLVLDRLDEALEVYRHTILLDPLNFEAYVNLAWLHLAEGREQQALDALRTARRIKPGFPFLGLLEGYVSLLQGEAQSALDKFSGTAHDGFYSADRLGLTAMALYSLGQREAYQAVLSELTTRFGERRPDTVAQVYAWAGDADGCFDWLGRAAGQHIESLQLVRFSREFDAVRDDPRWALFRQRIGQSPETIAAVRFNLSLPLVRD